MQSIADSNTTRPSARTVRALDLLCMCIGDVGGGIGPYLSGYLKAARHWDAAAIGSAISVMSIVTLIAQTPAGALVDKLKQKRLLVALSALLISLSCFAITIFPQYYAVMASQVVYGLAAALLAPAIVAITLGLVGQKRFSARIGRNEACNHFGNVVAAMLTGTAAYYLTGDCVFYIVAIFAVGCIFAVSLIREEEIDHEVARGSKDESGEDDPVLPLYQLIRERRILMFGVAVALFHLSNAAMLPLAGQYISEGHSQRAAVSISACILAAQLVMIPVSMFTGKFADSWGRKPVFMVAFAVLPLRGLLYTISSDPLFIIAVQLLDGIGAGIFGVLISVIVADLTAGTGHYNVVRGFAVTAQGLGAATSNILAGYIVKSYGYPAGFQSLAAIGLVGLLVFCFGVSETRRAQ